MYRKAINFLRGNISVEITAPYPERVLNLCGVHQIPFWDLEWKTETQLFFRTSVRGVRRLRQILDESMTLEVKETGGVPVLWSRVKRRYVLLAGFALFWLLLFGGNTFIWGFEVTGNDTVPTEQILRALENYGLGIGSPALSIHQEDIRNHVLLELPDVSWLAVNVKGCIAHVQVVERSRPPETVREDEMTNVVARCSGLVTKVEALDGTAQVTAGTTVTEGELLISGVADNEPGGVRLMHGQGYVWARTWHQLSVRVPLVYEEKSGQKKERQRSTLILGKKRIKIFEKGSKTGVNCDKIIQYRFLSLAGLRLPVTWETEKLISYEPVAVRRDIAAAQHEGETQLLQELRRELGENGTITDSDVSASREGDYLLVMLRAECEEEIGRSVIIADDGKAG